MNLKNAFYNLHKIKKAEPEKILLEQWKYEISNGADCSAPT